MRATDTGLHRLAARASELPDRLREVRPPLEGLWVAGDPTSLTEGVRIGIIGSRRPRRDSVEFVRTIASGVARAGMTVVSGLAIGVDGMAHRHALAAGGRTIAVLPRGVDHVYPATNLELARRIAGGAHGRSGVRGTPDARGAVVSEYAPADPAARRERFLARNRLIAAMSDYLVVVQAHERSGSMNTAAAALELGVPIGVVPSGTEDPCYAGSIDLIRDGADCIVDVRSLILRLLVHGIIDPRVRETVDRSELGALVLDPASPTGWSVRPDAQLSLTIDHPLASLITTPRPTEEIADLAGIDLRDARRMLAELEQSGWARFTPEGCWVASAAGVE